MTTHTMKNKVGRPKGVNQTEKKIKLDNELLDYWDKQKNKNRMANEAIKQHMEREEVKNER